MKRTSEKKSKTWIFDVEIINDVFLLAIKTQINYGGDALPTKARDIAVGDFTLWLEKNLLDFTNALIRTFESSAFSDIECSFIHQQNEEIPFSDLPNEIKRISEDIYKGFSENKPVQNTLLIKIRAEQIEVPDNMWIEELLQLSHHMKAEFKAFGSISKATELETYGDGELINMTYSKGKHTMHNGATGKPYFGRFKEFEDIIPNLRLD